MRAMEARHASRNNRCIALGLQISKLRADAAASGARLAELEGEYARSVDESARARRAAEAASRARAEDVRGMGARLAAESRLVDELRSRIARAKIVAETAASSSSSARPAAAVAAAAARPKKKTRQQQRDDDDDDDG